jgi:kynurenine formamidase
MTSSRDTGTGPAPAPTRRMTEAEFRSLYERLRAQPPWGPADSRGALNYLTPATTLAAAGEVKLGRSVSLAGPIEYSVTADNPEPARHKMTQTGDSAPDDGLAFAMDQISMNIHGNADTHIDALSHVIYDGRLYNNRTADIVSDTGAAELSIAAAANGIVGRGVLLDVPRTRGVPWLDPGDRVTADDLTAAEREQQVKVGQGDLVFIRVGHRLRRFQLGPWDAADARAGLHPAVMEYAADRKIALLGSDGNNDTAPSVVPGVDFPRACARDRRAWRVPHRLYGPRGPGPGMRRVQALVLPVRDRAAPPVRRHRIPGQPDRNLVTALRRPAWGLSRCRSGAHF